MTDTFPVFLNEQLVRMPAGATVSDLVARHAPELAGDVAAGRALVTDARGLGVAVSTPLAAGAVLRVFRSARTAPDPADG